MSHLEDNPGAADIELTAEEVAGLDAMMQLEPAYPNWFNEGLVEPPHKEALGFWGRP